ncbi:MAG: S8 family serine peptidase [Thermoleophilia bacterium]|nr:S8 family serine peptidase [Thermoleophilia bacterium]
MTFVNLETGSRTYIASLKVAPNFAPALAAGTRADRKSLAYNAMVDAELAAKTTLLPKLDALKGEGLLKDYDFATGTGAVILNVDDTRAAAAYQALQGLGELGRIVRNREVKLDTIVQGDVPAPTAGEKTVEWNVDKVNAQGAWAKGVTGEGVVVGIVDTGANVQHEALKAHFRGTQADGTFDYNYNFYDPINGKTEAYDDHSHGSHVAGTSVGGTADHLTGMAPGAKFISTKVFTAGGSGSTATILKGLSWMLAPTKSDGTAPDPTKAPDLVSNSWGNSNGASLSYLDAWKAFEAAGIIPVVAAGNSGPRANTVGAPGSYPQSITVGATDKDDKVARFSSRGPSRIKDADGNFINKPDVSAPGVDVISAGKSGDQYVKMSGTSMATPAVSGMVALLLSKYPNLTGEQVREVLTKSAVDIDEKGYDLNTGWGRVDAVRILETADEMFGQKPPTPPTQG